MYWFSGIRLILIKLKITYTLFVTYYYTRRLFILPLSSTGGYPTIKIRADKSALVGFICRSCSTGGYLIFDIIHSQCVINLINVFFS